MAGAEVSLDVFFLLDPCCYIPLTLPHQPTPYKCHTWYYSHASKTSQN